MNHEGMHERCEEMTLKELLRATTLDRDEFDPAFVEIAQSFLNRRWMEVQELRNKAIVQIHTNPAENVDKEGAMKALEAPLDLWHSVTIRNCLDDMVILQRDRSGWTGHLVIHEEYGGTFRTGINVAQSLVARFLELDYQVFESIQIFDISKMAILIETESYDYTMMTTDKLEARGIDYIVQTRVLARFFQDEETSIHGLSFIVLVPVSTFDDARMILDEIEATIAALHEEAERYSNEGNTEAELETFQRIVRMVPTDHIATFNLGAVLFESERYEEAIEQFAKVLLKAGIKAADDVEEYCVEIVTRIPDSIDSLHILTDIERIRGNAKEAIAYIERILTINNDDAIAHLNLGYILYEESDDDAEALGHLRRYLELKPDADDRETIEAMISELE